MISKLPKIVYIAHPISGDIDANLKDIIRILRIINTDTHPRKVIKNPLGGISARMQYDFSNIVPVVPYYADILALDDNNPLERLRGIANDTELIKSGVFEECWLTGHKLSFGMSQEVNLFTSLHIPIINYMNKI